MGRAPFLRFHERVKTVEIYVLVMRMRKHTDAPLVDKEHVEQLRVAAKTLQEHGDLREPNTLITTGGFGLVGFDWCGEAGTAKYLADISLISDLGSHNEVRRGDLIAKGHDARMFELLTRLSH